MRWQGFINVLSIFFLSKWSLAICEYHSLRIQIVIHWPITCITPSFMWYFSVDVHSTGRPGDDVVRGRRSAGSRRRRWRSMSHQRLKINRSRTFHNMKRHEIEIELLSNGPTTVEILKYGSHWNIWWILVPKTTFDIVKCFAFWKFYLRGIVLWWLNPRVSE